MRPCFASAVIFASAGFACTQQTTGANPADAATTAAADSDGATKRADAAAETLPDGGAICPEPLPEDASVSSLSDLPLAIVCGSTFGFPNDGAESNPCQGTIKVTVSQGADCGLWWLFDAVTGELDAIGHDCAGRSGTGCSAARPGFSYPHQCDDGNGWSGWLDLCTDASAVVAGDASTDACAPSRCTASCAPGTHDIFSVVDGCVVWQCCV
jgi:hypothetical protein